jgi:GDPmannose 4,6-dehydratase
MSKRAIITGVYGQDASYLAELLIEKNYDVYGLYKRTSTGNNTKNISNIIANNPRFHLLEADICDHGQMNSIISDIKPDEFYNLAAQSHVGYSFKIPVETFRVDAEAVIGQLQALQKHSPGTKFYQASTSELYGGLNCPYRDGGYTEGSPFHPRSPYAIAKQAAYYSVVNAREAYKIFACNGILFNHSSPRRGEDFASRKITKGIASIKAGLTHNLHMGNLKAYRDEGHSKDYVKAMWLILQQEKPEDYVVATGEGASIEDMFKYVCELAELNFENVYVPDERFMRPSEVPVLLGNPAKIKSIGWKPEYSWKKLLKEMYENDLKELSK